MENKNELLKLENITAEVQDSILDLEDGVENIHFFHKYCWVAAMFLTLFHGDSPVSKRGEEPWPNIAVGGEYKQYNSM